MCTLHAGFQTVKLAWSEYCTSYHFGLPLNGTFTCWLGLFDLTIY